MNEKELQIRLKLRNDFPHYAYKCLKIRKKNGELVPFALNKAQLYFLAKIEEEKKKKGMVRVILVKGRQMGLSTQIEGMFYHIVTHKSGTKAFILTHQQDATDTIFEIVKTFHENCPIIIRPIVDGDSAKKLNFISPAGSGYKVGTARSKGLGRGGTVQLFHGSEVAFWEKGEKHLDGILQSVPREKNTQIILESTANGKGNMFHTFWEEANAGINEFTPIFIPWYWEPKYREPLPLDEDFILTDEESEYARIYDLDKEQINFRRITTNNSQLKELGFQQEYPACAEEAFITSGQSFITGRSVEKARKCQSVVASGLKYIGVDPAGAGENADRTSIIIRQGRKAYGLKSYQYHDTMEIVGLIVRLIKEEKPDFVCVDTIGIGVGVGDRLKELGYGSMIRFINSAETKSMFHPDRYNNKRAEMWGLMKEWFESEPVSIPDENSLAADLASLSAKPDSLNRVKLQSKKEITLSPDEADALALTFAFPAVTNHANIGNLLNPNIRI